MLTHSLNPLFNSDNLWLPAYRYAVRLMIEPNVSQIFLAGTLGGDRPGHVSCVAETASDASFAAFFSNFLS